MNNSPGRCCSTGKQLGSHFHPEGLSWVCSSLQCVPVFLPITGACPRILPSHELWDSSCHQCHLLPEEEMGARSSSLWGYFSFLIIGSSLDEKMWICCWGHIFLLFCVLFFCSSCHQSSVNTYTLMLNPFVTSSDFCLISGHNFSFFWGCNICVNRSFRMVSKEPERCLAASSRSERLGCCLFGLC